MPNPNPTKEMTVKPVVEDTTIEIDVGRCVSSLPLRSLAVAGITLVAFVIGFMIPHNPAPTFVYSDDIPPKLLDMLKQDVVKPGVNNVCEHDMTMALWIAPGDLCSLKNMGRLANHPNFQHCTSEYVDDYLPNHHVKACLSYEDVSYLWDTGHCWQPNSAEYAVVSGVNVTVRPQYRRMHEGLMFCGDNRCSATDSFYDRIYQNLYCWDDVGPANANYFKKCTTEECNGQTYDCPEAPDVLEVKCGPFQIRNVGCSDTLPSGLWSDDPTASNYIGNICYI